MTFASSSDGLLVILVVVGGRCRSQRILAVRSSNRWALISLKQGTAIGDCPQPDGS